METWINRDFLWNLNSLNPYYNGRYSWRSEFSTLCKAAWPVLILIVMEDTHGV